MKVSINEQRCQGHGRCYGAAPDLFGPDDEFGHAEVLNDGIFDDDPVVVAAARRAAANCPEEAITILTGTEGEGR